MRKLKFRVWDIKKRTMKCPNEIFYLGTLWQHDNAFGFQSTKRYIIQEFTGLFDKKNQPIYEGDIISYGPSYNPLTIEYNSRIAAFTASGLLLNTNVGRHIHTAQYEIIGNVFEKNKTN